jgi:MFS family permease
MTRRRLTPQVIILGFVSLLNDSASEMIYPLLPLFLSTTLGATPIVIGMIEGAADGLASILKFYAGSLSDRVKRRKPLIGTGYALAAGSRALIAAAGSWVAVLSARLIDRTGKGIRSAPRDAMISDVTAPENRGRAFGFHRAMDHTGAIVGPLLTVLLMQGLHLDMRHVFWLAVIPGFIAVFLIVFVLKEAPADDRRTRIASENTNGRLSGAFWRVIVAIGLFSLANSSDAFLLLQAGRAGVATAMLPLLWAAHHVVKSLFSTHAGALSDRSKRAYFLALGWALYAITYALFQAADTLATFFALFVFYAVPFTLTEGAERALIADSIPAESRGRGFGIYYLVTGLGVLAGSTLFGFLYQRFSPGAAFATGAVLAACAAIAILFASRPADQPA